jgi:membrane-associated phospholipid phosphatase
MAYVLVMAFTLVYTAEHYVVDILLGWLLAAVVVLVINRFGRRRSSASDRELPTNAAVSRTNTVARAEYYDSCAAVEKM